MANKLDKYKSREVQDLIVKHREDIEKGSYTHRSFGEFATKGLGYIVTESNVKGMADVVKVEFKGSNNGSPGLENFRQQKAAIKAVAKALVDLSDRIAEHVPPEIRLIAGDNEEKE